jgi:hypothetical protein
MLAWDDVKDKFENLVKFAAKQVYNTRNYSSHSVDNSVGIEDLYQIGMMKLYDCWLRYSKLPMGEFKSVFSAALFRAVRRGAKPSMTIDLEDAVMEVESKSEEPDLVESIYFREGLQQLKSLLETPIARAIFQEIIEPSPRTIWEVWADKARKNVLKQQGKEINLSKTSEVRMKHIRNSLHITQKQFDLGISEIRRKAREAFHLGELFLDDIVRVPIRIIRKPICFVRKPIFIERKPICLVA